MDIYLATRFNYKLVHLIFCEIMLSDVLLEITYYEGWVLGQLVGGRCLKYFCGEGGGKRWQVRQGVLFPVIEILISLFLFIHNVLMYLNMYI